MSKKRAPGFSLRDQDNITRSLENYKGRWVVVYFYPSDNSLNCTREACNFRDEYRIIAQFGNAEVIGINRGSVNSHKRFAKRHQLNFPLLSDPDHKVTSVYGAWRNNPVSLIKPLGTKRNTYLIDPEGFIIKTYTDVDPNDHAQEVISDLQELQRPRRQPRKASKAKAT